MKESKLVWSDEHGDMRKKGKSAPEEPVNEAEIELHVRRLTSGKGRTIIEITNLPSNKNWCKKLAKELKKVLAVGGAYKQSFIEIHGEKMDQTIDFLNSKSLKNKKTGG